MTATTFQHQLAAYIPRVHRAALGFLGEEQEAREVAQEALLKAYAARDRYDESRPFYPWLYRIVKNTCLDALARRRHRAVSGLQPERVANSEPSPLDRLSQAEAIGQVRAAMEHLSPEQREIISMRHFQDLTYAEIAQILDVAQGTVMSRLYRARKALLAVLEGS
ncbi:MAG: RNA polymerase sigma factor [Proteobacteria bacterium]|jgi:RNA polymerase sigma-70 factor, ECF subfamily|nr:RNA polymerase sigma factor [Pseudomonadota bacterium]